MQNQHAIFNAASHGAKLVERPAESHGAVAGNAAVCGTKSGDAATHAGAYDAAAGLTADGKSNQASSGRRAGTSAGSRCTFFQQPWVHGLAAEPYVVERKRAQTQLGDQNCAGIIEPLYNGCVSGGNAITKWLRAVGSGNAGGIEQILAAPGNPVQRPAIFSRSNFLVGLLGLRQRMITGQCDHAMQFGIEALKPVEINIGEPDGSELALFHPARQMRERSKGNVFIVGWERPGIELAPDELVTRGKLFSPGRIGFHSEYGETVDSIATFLGPVRRS